MMLLHARGGVSPVLTGYVLFFLIFLNFILGGGVYCFINSLNMSESLAKCSSCSRQSPAIYAFFFSFKTKPLLERTCS